MANFSEIIQFPTNLKWELLIDCICPNPNFNCWKPEIYSKPVECFPSYIDFNAPFHGIPLDVNNSSNFWLHIQNGLGLILQVLFPCSLFIFHQTKWQVASLIFAILSFLSFRHFRQMEANPVNDEVGGWNSGKRINFRGKMDKKN